GPRTIRPARPPPEARPPVLRGPRPSAGARNPTKAPQVPRTCNAGSPDHPRHRISLRPPRQPPTAIYPWDSARSGKRRSQAPAAPPRPGPSPCGCDTCNSAAGPHGAAWTPLPARRPAPSRGARTTSASNAQQRSSNTTTTEPHAPPWTGPRRARGGLTPQEPVGEPDAGDQIQRGVRDHRGEHAPGDDERDGEQEAEQGCTDA